MQNQQNETNFPVKNNFPSATKGLSMRGNGSFHKRRPNVHAAATEKANAAAVFAAEQCGNLPIPRCATAQRRFDFFRPHNAPISHNLKARWRIRRIWRFPCAILLPTFARRRKRIVLPLCGKQNFLIRGVKFG